MEIRANDLRAGINLCFNCAIKCIKLFNFLEIRKYFDVLPGISNICKVPFIGFVIEDLKIYWKIHLRLVQKDCFRL